MPQLLLNIKKKLFNNYITHLDRFEIKQFQKNHDYLEWINGNLISIAEGFIEENAIFDSFFVRALKRIFSTRFELFIQRWTVEYYLKLFRILDEYKTKDKKEFSLALEDNPLNRYGVDRFVSRFNASPAIQWHRQPNALVRIAGILVFELKVLKAALNTGIKLFIKRKKYLVMRESLWGLYDVEGSFFHDDFIVDEKKIRKNDLLLFSRGIPAEECRLKAYHDARRSPYAHFNLFKLPLSLGALCLRVIPIYSIASMAAVLSSLLSENFYFFFNIFSAFFTSALPYEKVFCNYSVTSELGHNNFISGHIAEAIICENHGTKYYLIHWSDNSVGIDSHLLSFLGCDTLLLWGSAHIQSVKMNPQNYTCIGYVFKKFINETIKNRTAIRAAMNIAANGKIISFFDESFGREIKMTEENFVVFWETILRVAVLHKNETIVIKQKNRTPQFLSENMQRRFHEAKNLLKDMENVRIFDNYRWSFIEAIGISDIVVTQGMTSSATIALICGIEGLYFDQVQYTHPFSVPELKNRIVFTESQELIQMINEIVAERKNPSQLIPYELMRKMDAFEDDRGIDLLRAILSGKKQREDSENKTNQLQRKEISIWA